MQLKGHLGELQFPVVPPKNLHISNREHRAHAGGVRPLQGEHGLPVPLSHALHALHLIDDQALPAHPREGREALEELLVGRDADVEAVGLRPLLQHTSQASPPAQEQAAWRGLTPHSPCPHHCHSTPFS